MSARRKVTCVMCKGVGKLENFDTRNPDLREIGCSECQETGVLDAGRASELLTRWRYEDKMEAQREADAKADERARLLRDRDARHQRDAR